MQKRFILSGGLAAISLAVAACGTTTPSAGSASPAAQGSMTVIAVADNPKLGKILVDGGGKTVYLFEADKGTASTCDGDCATYWPPVLPTVALSVLMFTGASQFAMVGVIGAGGSVWAGAATAALLGTRNALYGVRLSSLLGVTGPRRAASAHFVIDETTAMAIARDTAEKSRFAFWATGLAVFTLWNMGTLIGAVATHAL